MIPLRDANPTRRRPLVTLGLIAVNLAAFFLWQGGPLFGEPSRAQAEIWACYGAIPFELSHFEHAPRFAPFCGDTPLLLPLLTSMFLHGNFLHIAGNMLFLWVFGNNIEDTAGRVRFVIFYLVTGLAAGLAHVLANSQSVVPTIGASGAVSGLLGAYIVLFPRARVTSILPLFFYWTTVRLPAFVVLGIWFLSQFLIAAQQPGGGGSGVAWMAHVGGFVAGAILIFLFGGWRRRPQPVTQYW